ncbi:MAG: TolC family protein [Bacteroidota bacterium]|nr:TolC family protein [Bacteroidota bacterium]
MFEVSRFPCFPHLFPYSFFLFVSAQTILAQPRVMTFDEAVRIAVERNERAAIATATVDAAQARVAIARSSFFPMVSLTGTYNRRPFESVRIVGDDRITIQSYHAFAATANVSVPLIAPSLFANLSVSRAERNAITVESRNDIRRLAFETASAFLEALGTAEVAAASERRLDFARQNLDASRARFDAQLVGRNDLTRAELEYATAEREHTNARSAHETAMFRLAFLLGGQRPDSLVVPSALLTEAVGFRPDEEELIHRAESCRPDLRAKTEHAAALGFATTAAMLGALPTLSAIGQYRLTNESGFSGRTWNWFVGASLNWNILDGGLWLAQREERDALHRVAEWELSQARRGISLEIRSAVTALENARAALKQAEVALEAARRNAEETRELYRQGLIDAVTAADANVRLYEADVARTRQRYALASALLNVYDTTGLDPFGQDIDSEAGR